MSKKQQHVSIVLIGETAVGKSSLIRRFDKDSFNSDFYTTIGTDVINKEVVIDGEKVMARLWDTAGQERFKTITKSFYQRADGIMLVYDVTNHNSYDKVNSWMDNIENSVSSNVAKFLVANKTDLVEIREVTEEEGKTKAQQLKIPYYETSAKTSINVTTVFETIIQSAYTKKRREDNIVLKEKHEGKKGCC